MRQLVLGIGLALLTAACASPWASKKRPVVRRSAPVVYVAPQPVGTSGTAGSTTTVGDYDGTYPMAGGGSGTTAPATGGGTSNPHYGDDSTSPAGSSGAFQKNPVPGSVREYINRYESGGAMAK